MWCVYNGNAVLSMLDTVLSLSSCVWQTNCQLSQVLAASSIAANIAGIVRIFGFLALRSITCEIESDKCSPQRFAKRAKSVFERDVTMHNKSKTVRITIDSNNQWRINEIERHAPSKSKDLECTRISSELPCSDVKTIFHISTSYGNRIIMRGQAWAVWPTDLRNRQRNNKWNHNSTESFPHFRNHVLPFLHRRVELL